MADLTRLDDVTCADWSKEFFQLEAKIKMAISERDRLKDLITNARAELADLQKLQPPQPPTRGPSRGPRHGLSRAAEVLDGLSDAPRIGEAPRNAVEKKRLIASKEREIQELNRRKGQIQEHIKSDLARMVQLAEFFREKPCPGLNLTISDRFEASAEARR